MKEPVSFLWYLREGKRIRGLNGGRPTVRYYKCILWSLILEKAIKKRLTSHFYKQLQR